MLLNWLSKNLNKVKAIKDFYKSSWEKIEIKVNVNDEITSKGYEEEKKYINYQIYKELLIYFRINFLNILDHINFKIDAPRESNKEMKLNSQNSEEEEWIYIFNHKNNTKKLNVVIYFTP